MPLEILPGLHQRARRVSQGNSEVRGAHSFQRAAGPAEAVRSESALHPRGDRHFLKRALLGLSILNDDHG
jgi:hypothetical protein